MKTLLGFLLLIGCAGPSDAKTLCAIGDSITEGYKDATHRVDAPPPAALQTLLHRAPIGHAWRFARVQNFGVGASSTTDWLTGPPNAAWVCPTQMDLPQVNDACTRGSSLLEGVRRLNVRCDGWLVMLGLNDWIPGLSVEQSADNLAAIAAELGPAPVWIAAPTHVQNFAVETRRNQLRNLLVQRGMLNGIDPPVLPLLPDGIHPNDAGAAALGGLWFGLLR